MNDQEYFNNYRDNIRFRVYWFIENDTVLVTSEKVGSSFLDNIVQKSKNKVLYFVIKKENDEKLFSFKTEDYIFQILDITEKQYKIELNNFIDKSNELKYIFITRDPVEKFVSAFYQYVKDLRNGIFITMYDFFNGNQINNSFNLIEKSLIHVGINSLSNEEFNSFTKLLYYTIIFNFSDMIRDVHFAPHNKNLTYLISNLTKNKQIKNFEILDIKKLDHFLLENNFINTNLVFMNKNKSINSLKDEKNFFNILSQMNSIERKSNHIYELFLDYFKFYVETETIFYENLFTKNNKL